MVAKNSITEKFIKFITFEDRDDRPQLKKWLQVVKPTLVGYNSYSFDIPVLSKFLSGCSLNKLYDFSGMIIESDQWTQLPKEYYDHRKFNVKNIDIMRVLSLDGVGVSLKQTGILLKMPRIQELPLPPNTTIKKEDIPVVGEYCMNDVDTTEGLLLKGLADIELRNYISSTYNIDVMNLSESHIANRLSEKLYAEATHENPILFKEKRTYRDVIKVGDCIGKNISFVSKPMQKFLEEFKQEEIKVDLEDEAEELDFAEILQDASLSWDDVIEKQDQTKLKKQVIIGTTKYDIGVGGLHSVDKPGVFESNDKFTFTDADVTSFYPYIMLHNGYYPAHLNPAFLDMFQNLVDMRIGAKKDKDKLRAYALKIVINAIYGKTNCDTFWMYDPLVTYSVTISGQLYLLSLIDRLEAENFKVVSANTDGIITKVDKQRETLYTDICQKWQQDTNFELEFNPYKKYVRRDVNNYLAVYKNGEIKTKGAFEDITEIPFSFSVRKSYKMPIVQKALKSYFVDDVSVEESIKNGTSIHDYLLSQKPGKKFRVFHGRTETQRINRFYVSIRGKQLYKVAQGQRLAIVKEPVTLANEILDDNLTNYPDLDYNWYIREVTKISDKIKPSKIKASMF